MRRFRLAAILALAAAAPGHAQPIASADEYKTCLILAKTKPESGWEEALAWQSLGGGEAARHCAAVALIGLGKYGEAATRLETLANESVREDAVRAEMLAQAAQAWLLLGKLPRADAALRSAERLQPGSPELMLDRAVVLAQAKNYREASDVLSRLLLAQPNRVEALALRASALRYLDDMLGALDDVETALKLDPDYPDALLERGILRRLKGEDAGAREDWLRAIRVLPDSPVADTARLNLERMDVKVK